MEIIANLKKNGVLNIKNVLDFELIEKAKEAIEGFIHQKSNIYVLITPQNVVRKIRYAFEKDEVFFGYYFPPKSDSYSQKHLRK